ncbi:MAG TPA: hypothetical protein PK728_06845 [Bacillota bacterium]|nr:hypothetical protein [Bacillota bacterium]
MRRSGKARPVVRRQKNGFTFLEAVFAAVVTGVVLSLAVPAMLNPLERFRVVTAARLLESDIRGLQQAALSLEDNGYNIVFFSSFYLVRRDSTNLKRVNLPAGVAVVYNNFPSGQLNINLKGLPVKNGHVKICGETTGETRYVIVYALTGRIRIDTLPPD